MKWVVIIHFPITEDDLKRMVHADGGMDIKFMARHPEAFLTEKDELILFDDPIKAYEEGLKMIRRLPPLKYAFSVVNVR